MSHGAVLFDMDGTLVDREPLAAVALVEACAEAGWRIPDEALRSLVGRAWQDVHRELGLRERLDWDVDDFVASVADRCIRLGEERGVPVLDGAVELVLELAAHEVPLGVVTGSTGAEVAGVLDLLGLAEAFEHVVAAEHYAAGKPSPEPYEVAVSRFGATASRCVAVEDSDAGVTAARAAGLRVVATHAANVPPGSAGRQDLSGAHLVVPALTHPELVAWVLDVVRTGTVPE